MEGNMATVKVIQESETKINTQSQLNNCQTTQVTINAIYSKPLKGE